MPTNKPKITAYVDPIIWEKIAAYADEHGFSMSYATEQLLITHFFGETEMVQHQVEHQVEHQEKDAIAFCTKEEVESLIDFKFAQLTDQINNLLSDLQTQLKKSEQAGEVLPAGETKNASQGDEALRLTGSELGNRLGVHPGTLNKNRDKSNFGQWSASLDPNGFSWKYSKRDGKYHARR
jgi:hypothetical protein